MPKKIKDKLGDDYVTIRGCDDIETYTFGNKMMCVFVNDYSSGGALNGESEIKAFSWNVGVVESKKNASKHYVRLLYGGDTSNQRHTF